MLILKPITFCIVSMMFILLMKNIFPEITPILTLASGIIVIVYIVPYVETILNTVYYLENISSGVNDVIKLTLKIIIISLVCEFASQLCNDSGEGYLAAKINFIGKVFVLSSVAPQLITFVKNILELINGYD